MNTAQIIALAADAVREGHIALSQGNLFGGGSGIGGQSGLFGGAGGQNTARGGASRSGPGRWITTHGHPVFIAEGRDVGQALREHFNGTGKSVTPEHVQGAARQIKLQGGRPNVHADDLRPAVKGPNAAPAAPPSAGTTQKVVVRARHDHPTAKPGEIVATHASVDDAVKDIKAYASVHGPVIADKLNAGGDVPLGTTFYHVEREHRTATLAPKLHPDHADEVQMDDGRRVPLHPAMRVTAGDGKGNTRYSVPDHVMGEIDAAHAVRQQARRDAEHQRAARHEFDFGRTTRHTPSDVPTANATVRTHASENVSNGRVTAIAGEGVRGDVRPIETTRGRNGPRRYELRHAGVYEVQSVKRGRVAHTNYVVLKDGQGRHFVDKTAAIDHFHGKAATAASPARPTAVRPAGIDGLKARVIGRARGVRSPGRDDEPAPKAAADEDWTFPDKPVPGSDRTAGGASNDDQLGIFAKDAHGAPPVVGEKPGQAALFGSTAKRPTPPPATAKTEDQKLRDKFDESATPSMFGQDVAGAAPQTALQTAHLDPLGRKMSEMIAADKRGIYNRPGGYKRMMDEAKTALGMRTTLSAIAERAVASARTTDKVLTNAAGDRVYLSASDAGIVYLSATCGLTPAVTLGQGLPERINGLPVHFRWVDAAYTGDWAHPKTGRPVPITNSRIDGWVSNIKLSRKRGVNLPVCKDHHETADNSVGEIFDARRTGGRLDLLLGFKGDDALKIGQRNYLSIGIDGNFKDSKKNAYGEAIRHVAVTPVPVIHGQVGFLDA